MDNSKEVYYLALDPGGNGGKVAGTGYVGFNSEGKGIRIGICRTHEELHDLLSTFTSHPPKEVILEAYILYQKKAMQQAGSKLLTVQAIGAIKTFARIWGAKVIEQPASILPIARLWSGVDDRKGSHKDSHHVSAFNHGVYYLTKKGILKSRVLGAD